MLGFTYSSFTHKLDSIDDVIMQFLNLEEELQNTQLQKLIHFTRTYRYITEAVNKSLEKDYFNEKNRMIQFDIAFALYYFKALKMYCAGHQIPPAWKTCFEYCSQNSSKNTVAMALGINAHVNNDLSQTLLDCNFGQSYRSDFARVNTVIKNQIPKIFKELNDDSFPFNTLGKVPFVYYPSLNTVIVLWRQNAWNNYIILIKNKKTREDIENEGRKMAERLLLLS